MLPERLKVLLGESMYKRKDLFEVGVAIKDLEVSPSKTFLEFYERYEGPFWEGNTGFELLDIVEDEERNIGVYTRIARKEHGFKNSLLVLSEMTALAVLVLDTLNDKVYKVNFEGGQRKLLQGKLEPDWPSFYDFLFDYFDC